MNGTSFRRLLGLDNPLIGTIVSMASLESIEILCRCGFDWLFLDLEHGALSTSQAQGILQVAQPYIPVITRVARCDEVEVKRALDIGSDGIIVPLVNSSEQAEAAVRFAKYPPRGTRSVGVARAHGYGASFARYVAEANEKTAVIVQIEHKDGVAAVDQIVQVEAIDAILVGPYDLSASMGLTGQVTHPDVQAAIATVRTACKARGLPYGFFGVTPEALLAELDNGAGFVIMGMDTLHLISGAKAALAPLVAWRDAR